MRTMKCPECDAEIEVSSDVVEGEILECPECGLELEIVGISDKGIEAKPAEIEGEDWGQ